MNLRTNLYCYTLVCRDAEKYASALRRYIEALDALNKTLNRLEVADEDYHLFPFSGDPVQWQEHRAEYQMERILLKTAISICRERWEEIVSNEDVAWGVASLCNQYAEVASRYEHRGDDERDWQALGSRVIDGIIEKKSETA